MQRNQKTKQRQPQVGVWGPSQQDNRQFLGKASDRTEISNSYYWKIKTTFLKKTIQNKEKEEH